MNLAISFYLKKSTDEKSIIYISLSFRGNRKMITTGISINPKYWDSKKNRIKTSYSSAMVLNNTLEKIADVARDHFNKYLLKNATPDMNDIQNEVKRFLRPDTFKSEFSFADAFQEFLIEREKKNVASFGTIKHYQSFFNRLIKLFPDLKFENINNKFHTEYNYHLSKEMNFTDNYIGFHIKTLKTFMRWAQNKGYHNNEYYKEMKVIHREVDNVALTLQELDILETLEFTKKDIHLKIIRDLFLLQCYTGLRVSDLMDLEPTNIDYENNVIRVTTRKTKDKILIGISNRIKKILDRLPDQKIKKIEEQYYNRAIKEICKLAGFDEKIKIIEFRGTKRVAVEYPKYDLITSHTARRTFITVSLKAGVLPESIMKITGHKDRKSFNKYVKIAQNDAIEEVKKVWE